MPGRIARPSSTQALRQVGMIGDLPVDLRPDVQGTLELRPQRLEEHHGYNIVRWGFRQVVGAVAARNSGLGIGLGGVPVGGPGSQAGALHVIRRIRNFSGSQLVVNLGALPAFANLVAGGVRALDSRWSPNASAAEIFNGIWQGGDVAALSGANVDALQAVPATGQADEVDPAMVFDQRANQASGDVCLIFCVTVNVQLNIAVQGYTVLPR